MKGLRWDLWLYGVASGFIGGGANAIVTGGAAMMVVGDVRKSLIIAGTAFLFSGLTHAAAYLKDHPLPDYSGAANRRNGNPDTRPEPHIERRQPDAAT